MGNTTGYADVNGLHMYYEVTGAGPPLLAMAGGTQSLEMFSDDVELLSKSFTVLSPEQMGHGRTADDTDREFDYHDMAEATYELLVHLGIESTLVYGFSDGGILGLDLAIHHPERVQRLAVSGTNFQVDGLRPSTREWILSASGETWPEHLRESYERLSPDGPQHWSDFIERIQRMWLAQPDYSTEELAQITAPTLVIAGDQDAITAEHTVALFRAIQNAQLCIVPNEGHGVLPEETVVSFLTASDADDD
jgi:pimeloyl-ACP methyl ester carboxylesterase